MSKPIADLKVYNDRPDAHVVFKDTYAYFDKNIMRAVAVFVGSESWQQDLSLLEAYSMPTIFCDPANHQPEWREAITTKKGKLMDWLGYLKENGCGQYFVNPKWIEPCVEMPGISSGTYFVEGNRVTMTSWDDLLHRANDLRGNSKAAEPYFGLCKIAVPNHEIEIINTLLSTQYRPSILYVRWTQSPDESQLHCEAAGHLQTCGYRLLAIYNGYFLYQFTGKDLYSICSWTEPSMNHPFLRIMTSEVSGALEELTKQTEKKTEETKSE
jgi:hypothetical protein